MAYVVVNRSGEFWDGTAWVVEYPAAEKYSTRGKAYDAAKYAAWDSADPRSCDVVENYGLESERVVWVVNRN